MKQQAVLRLAAAAASLFLLFSLAACGGRASNAADSASAQTAPAEESYDATLTDTTTAEGSALSDRKLITTADLSLDVTDFEAAVAEIEQQAAALGGYFASSSQGGSAERGTRWAEYHARIPICRQ